MIQQGDKVICIKTSKDSEYAPKIHEGRYYIVNDIRESCCGGVGISVGLDWKRIPVAQKCEICGKRLNDVDDVPYYKISCFRKIEPESRVIEVSESILEQAKKLLTPETIAQ